MEKTHDDHWLINCQTFLDNIMFLSVSQEAKKSHKDL